MNKYIVYKNNDTVTKVYTISNKGSKQTNVEVTFDISLGIKIVSVHSSKGTYSDNILTISELIQDESVSVTVKYVVENINLAPFTVTVSSNVLGCESIIKIEKSDKECEDCGKTFAIFPAFSADNGSYTNKTLVFEDSNISFSTLSNKAIAAYITNPKIYAGTDYTEIGELAFKNSNNVSFSLQGTELVASASYTQFPQAASASNSSINFNTLNFGNSGKLSHFITNNSVFISQNESKSIFALSNTTLQSSGVYTDQINLLGKGGVSVGVSNNSIYVSANTLSFQNSNGLTLVNNNGTITGSHNGLTSQLPQAVSGSNGSFTFDTLKFGNLNNFSFYTSNGSIVGSYIANTGSDTANSFHLVANGSTFTDYAQFENGNGFNFIAAGNSIFGSYTQAITTVSNSNNVTLGLAGGILTASINPGAQSNQTIGLFAAGNTTNNTSLTVDARSLTIEGLGGISIGYSNSKIQISGLDVSTYDTAYPNVSNYSFIVSSNNSSLQYVHHESIDENLQFNNVKLAGNFFVSTFTKDVGFLGTNTNTTFGGGGMIYNIYTKNNNSISLLSTAKVNYDYKFVTHSYNNATVTFTLGLGYTYNLGTFSSTELNTRTVVVNNQSSGDFTPTEYSGNVMIPLYKGVTQSLSQGNYYLMFNHTYNNQSFYAQSIGYKTIQSISYLDYVDFGNSSNKPLNLFIPVKNTITNATANVYNTVVVSNSANASYSAPALIFYKS